jgi:hypothetical protein
MKSSSQYKNTSESKEKKIKRRKWQLEAWWGPSISHQIKKNKEKYPSISNKLYKKIKLITNFLKNGITKKKLLKIKLISSF